MAKKLGQEMPVQQQGQQGEAEFVSVKPTVATAYTPDIGRRVDRMFEMSGSEIRKRWRENYNEEFKIPDHMKRVYHEELPPGALEVEPVDVMEESPDPKKKRFGMPRKAGAKEAAEKGKYPWYHFKCMLLTQNIVKEDTNKIVNIIILLIDIFIWVLLFLPRLIINILLFVVRIIKKLVGIKKFLPVR